jgi:ectoine hydroxylase-related dioxygenase (phytanoyl-CoA dioxygenase family)
MSMGTENAAAMRADWTRFQQALVSLHNEDVGFALSMHSELRDTVQEILGDRVVRHDAWTGIWGSEAFAHCDTLVTWRGPWDKVCRAWCALEDIGPESGPFYIFPGSHLSVRAGLCEETLEESPELIGILRALPSGDTRKYSFLQQASPILLAAQKLIASKTAKMRKAVFELRKGDVVIFCLDVIHGGMPIRNSKLTRKAMVIEWHASSAQAFSMSAFWGASHDYRCAENMLLDLPIVESANGAYRRSQVRS